MGEETNTRLTTTAFQVVAESRCIVVSVFNYSYFIKIGVKLLTTLAKSWREDVGCQPRVYRQLL